MTQLHEPIGAIDEERARSSFASTFKTAVEQDIDTDGFDGKLPVMGFSQVQHVVQDVLDPKKSLRDDADLVTSMWGVDGEAVKAFADRVIGAQP